ncbi:hypothetical protein Gotur_007815 [Gossypium turneri]
MLEIQGNPTRANEAKTQERGNDSNPIEMMKNYVEKCIDNHGEEKPMWPMTTKIHCSRKVWKEYKMSISNKSMDQFGGIKRKIE